LNIIHHFGENILTGLMTRPTVSEHWRRVASHPESSQSNHAHFTMLQ